MRKEKKGTLHFIAILAFVVFIVLGLASATAPQATVEFNQRYLSMTQPPASGERVIHRGISVNGSSSVCRNADHRVTPQRMGSSYQVREDRMPSRHHHEPILDQLLTIARNTFPPVLVQNVTIRNAIIAGNQHVNPRLEEYIETVDSGRRDANNRIIWQQVTRQRTIWDCFLIYSANITTNEPMPETVTHSADLAVAGTTRADLYRRVDNYFDDRRFNEANSLGIRISRTDFDVGRIRGDFIYAIPAMGSYRITSAFTIDVHDSRAEIRFTDTNMQRAIGSASEPIFLQSIASAASEELVNFTNSLRSYISTRR